MKILRKYQIALLIIIPLVTAGILLHNANASGKGAAYSRLETIGGKIQSLDFSSDGKSLASLSAFTPYNDGNIQSGGIQIWDVNGQSLPRQLTNFQPGMNPESVGNVVFSPNGKLLSTVASGVNVWNTRGWRSQNVRKNSDGAVFSPDGKLLAIMGDGGITLLNTDTWKTTKTIEIKGDLTAMGFSPDGKILAVADTYTAPMAILSGGIKQGGKVTSNVVLWEVRTGKFKRSIDQFSWIHSLKFSPNGKMIAVGGEDFMVRIWNATSGSLIHTFKHDNVVRAVVFGSDSKTIFSAGDDKTIRVWDTKLGSELSIQKYRTAVKSLALSPNGKLLASGNENGEILLYKTQDILK